MGCVPLCSGQSQQEEAERAIYDGRDYFCRDNINLDCPPNLFALYGRYTWGYRDNSHYTDYREDTWIPRPVNGQAWNIDWAKRDGTSNAYKCDDLIIPGYNDNERGAGVVCSMANKLQFRIDGVYNKDYEDIIKSVNVYITEPVSSYNLDKPLQIAYLIPAAMHYLTQMKALMHDWNPAGVTAYPKHKTNAEIIKELSESTMFYKVASIDYKSLGSQHEWIDIDLKTDGLLENLVQQERLEIDSFGRENYCPNVVYSYNGKMHIANYNKYLFKGYPAWYLYPDFNIINNTPVPTRHGKNTAKGSCQVFRYGMAGGNVSSSPALQTDFHYSDWLEVSGTFTDNGATQSPYVKAQYVSCTHTINSTSVTLGGKFYYSLVPRTRRVSLVVGYKAVVEFAAKSCLVPWYVKTQTDHWLTENLRVVDNATAKILGIEVTIQTQDGARTVRRHTETLAYIPFAGMLSYPDARANNMRVWFVSGGSVKYVDYTLKPHNFLPIAYYIAPDLKAIHYWLDANATTAQTVPTWITNPTTEQEGISEYYPNGLKVSAVNNPFYFPADATYQVGNAEIVALCANTMALSTGQWGAHPLFVFCKDGVYAMQVDSTGELTYRNCVPISREICNNARSVTPIDDAIVFTTDRGLMLMSGSNPIEISQPAEGTPINGTTLRGISQSINHEALTSLLGKLTVTDLKNYLANVRIGYNYLDRELWVTNPNETYTWVFRNNMWTKIVRRANYYIADYPRTYRVYTNALTGESHIYDIGTEETSAYGVGNDCYFLTRPIKLQTLGEKQSLRVSLRGYFKMNTYTKTFNQDTYTTLVSKTARLIVYGSLDARKWEMIGLAQYPDVPTAEQMAAGKMKAYDVTNRTFRDLSCTTFPQQVKFIRVAFVGSLDSESTIDYIEIQAKAPRDIKIR